MRHIALFLPIAHAWLYSSGQDLFTNMHGPSVKLRCVNWYGAHMELFVSNGLELRSCGFIADQIKSTGANCVRIPLSVQLVRDNPSPPPWAIAGLSDCNATTALGVLDCQVHELTSRGLMVILNNHNSFAGWVGSHENFSQGLWNLPGYPTSDWVSSLASLARRYRNNSRVVGLDIRNEIHDQNGTTVTWGQSDDVNSDWRAASMLADAAIREANPDILVIVSGLCMGYDLRAMQDLDNYRFKFVFTTHVYTYSWWFLQVDWNYVLVVGSVIALASALGAAWVATEKTPYSEMGYNDVMCLVYIVTASVLAPALGLVVSLVWKLESNKVGCSSIAADADPLLWVSVAWLTLALASLCILVNIENIFKWRLQTFWFCVWNTFIGALLVLFSLWFRTYGAVQWDLRRWHSSNIPVFVGEFGTKVGDNRVEWGWLMKHIEHMHYAYWALNGRRWRDNRWVDEEFGLLAQDWGSMRNPDWTKTIFK